MKTRMSGMMQLLIVGLFISFNVVPSALPLQSKNFKEEKTGKQRGPEYAAMVERKQEERLKRLAKISSVHEANRRSIEIVAPYWRVGDGFQSTLVVNNTLTREILVTPKVFTAAGKQLPAQAITVPTLGSITIPITDLIDQPRGEGQIALQYSGEPSEINAHLVIVNAERSLSVDHPFEAKTDYSTTQFEGVSYIPKRSARMEMALSNTRDRPVEVRLEVSAEGSENVKRPPIPLVVGPHQTELVDVQRLLGATTDPLARREEPSYPLAVRVALSHGGQAGDLRIHGIVMDTDGFSANVRFIETSMLKAPKLLSPLPTLPEPVNPVVLLSNPGTASAQVELEAYYTLGDEVKEMELITVAVPRHGVKHVELTEPLRSLPLDSTNIALVISTGGADVLADVLLIDSSGSGVYQVSPKGYSGHAHRNHDFPFRIDESMNTIVTVANPSETEPMSYSVHVFYQGGTYTYAAQPLRPGEVRHLDIKTLRDRSVPGQRQEVIPKQVMAGHVKVRFFGKGGGGHRAVHAGHDYGTEEAVGIAGALLFDAAAKISFWTCYYVCPPFLLSIGFVDESIEGEIADGSANVGNLITQYEDSSYDELEPGYFSFLDWDWGGGSEVAWGSGSTITFNYVGSGSFYTNVLFAECEGETYQEHCSSCSLEFANNVVFLWVTVADSPEIFMNNVNITNSTTEVIVGQRIALSFTTDGTATNPSWSVPGSTKGNYVVAMDFSTGATTEANFSQAAPVFYWADGGANRTVTLTVTVGGMTQSSSTTFNVVAPSGNMTTIAKGDAGVTIFGAPLLAGYGRNIDLTTVGIRFDNNYTIPVDWYGSFQWVQVFTSCTGSRTNAGTNTVIGYFAGGVLDTDYPYEVENPTTDSTESPLPVGFSKKSRDDSFVMTLMFQPSIADSIPVPIAKVAWIWGYEAISGNGGNNWALSRQTGNNSPLATVVTTEFPTWNGNYVTECVFPQ